SAHMAAGNRWAAHDPRPPVTLADVADHIEHVREVAGVEHVGIGSDYDGHPVMPARREGVSGYPALIPEPPRRGWAEADLAGLTRGNIIRVLHDAESARYGDWYGNGQGDDHARGVSA